MQCHNGVGFLWACKYYANRKTAQDWGGWFELLSFFVLTFLSHLFVWFRLSLIERGVHSSVFSFAFKYKFCVSSALFLNDDSNVFVLKFVQTSLQEDTPRYKIVLVKVRSVSFGAFLWTRNLMRSDKQDPNCSLVCCAAGWDYNLNILGEIIWSIHALLIQSNRGKRLWLFIDP